MKKIIISLISLFLMSNSYGSLYQCTEIEGEPFLQNNSNPLSSIKLDVKKATWQIDFKDKKKHRHNRKPYLFYYVIDSTEPFMSLSVNMEVAQLQKNCQESEYVNFVAILNSLYKSKNEIILCKDKHLQYVNLSSFPELDKNLKLKREFLRIGDHTYGPMGPLEFLVRYEDHTKEAFYEFPLAHPDFLYEMIKLVTTENSFFPLAKYMPFFNLKSHGSSETVLSGLYTCQIKAKTNTQMETMEKKLSQEEIQVLKKFNTPNLFQKNLKVVDTILKKLSLGSNISLLEDESLGSRNLGTEINSQESLFGLGQNDGLKSEFSFGVYHVALNNIISRFFNESSNRFLGFLMLEACDTNRDSTFSLKYEKNVLGYYSASSSLWYRNLNWWEILKESKNSTLLMVKNIDLQTQHIKNIRYSNENE